MKTPSDRATFLENLSADQIKRWLADVGEWLWASQQEPEGDWNTWLFLGGRGAGKTRAGAYWVAESARRARFRRIALIAPNLHDAREVMIDGPSGIRTIAGGQRPQYEITRRRLVWPNGAEAHCFSASDPESLRGPEFDAAWGDEIAYWLRPDETLKTLSHGLRRGLHPRLMVTTTPRPTPVLKDMAARHDTAVTVGTTFENATNLAPAFIAAMRARWRGTARDRQELHGELIADPEGALWSRAALEAARITHAPELGDVIVAVDPPASVGAGADACGIIAAGAQGEGATRHYYVLADASVQGRSPHEWAQKAAELARAVGAYAIVAEANNGGEMVRAVLSLAAPDLLIRLVRAHVDKRGRAAPIAALYDMNRVSHAGVFTALEDEMCAFGAPEATGSPDRVDALVWALTHLHGAANPRLRQV